MKLSLLTGADNETLAIGRVLGLVLFLDFVLFLPALIGGLFLLQGVKPDVWFGFLDKLMVYVPAMAIAGVALISGTAFTEPKADAAAPGGP